VQPYIVPDAFLPSCRSQNPVAIPSTAAFPHLLPEQPVIYVAFRAFLHTRVRCENRWVRPVLRTWLS
jgi:hypothetical protein